MGGGSVGKTGGEYPPYPLTRFPTTDLEGRAPHRRPLKGAAGCYAGPAGEMPDGVSGENGDQKPHSGCPNRLPNIQLLSWHHRFQRFWSLRSTTRQLKMPEKSR